MIVTRPTEYDFFLLHNNSLRLIAAIAAVVEQIRSVRVHWSGGGGIGMDGKCQERNLSANWSELMSRTGAEWNADLTDLGVAMRPRRLRERERAWSSCRLVRSRIRNTPFIRHRTGGAGVELTGGATRPTGNANRDGTAFRCVVTCYAASVGHAQCFYQRACMCRCTKDALMLLIEN